MLRKYWKDFVIFWSVFVVLVGGIFLFFYLISEGKLGFMPTFEELENPTNNFATEVYSDDGVLIGRYFMGNENRRYTNYDEIAPCVIDALIATEDARYYEHSGIDVRGLFRGGFSAWQRGCGRGMNPRAGVVPYPSSWPRCFSRGKRTKVSWSW